VDHLNVFRGDAGADEDIADGIGDGNDPVTGAGVLQPMDKRMSRGKGNMPRDDSDGVGSESRAECLILRVAGVSVDDVARSGAAGGNGKARSARAFGKVAIGWRDDGLRVAACAEGFGERKERLLAAAPGGVRVDVRDG
jgi:hypothetical protein